MNTWWDSQELTWSKVNTKKQLELLPDMDVLFSKRCFLFTRLLLSKF